MRIVHLIYSFNPGGVESFLLNLTSAMPTAKVESHIVSFFDGPLKNEYLKAGAIVHIVGSIRSVISHWNLYKTLKQINPDIVNNHILINSGETSLICKKLHYPFIQFSHNTRLVDYNSSFIYMMVVNCNLWFMKQFMSKGIGVSNDACVCLWGADYLRKNVEYVNLGIDFSRFKPDKVSCEKQRQLVRSYFEIPEDALVIANVAGYRPQKNYMFFIEVASILVRKIPNAYFVMIGDGSERQTMEEKIKSYGIESHCRLTGFVANVPEILKSAVDVFLFPSLFEGLGLALVEAQAAGLRCFYSDIIPKEAIVIPDLVKSLSLNNTAEEWADAICKYATESKHVLVDKNLAYEKVMESQFNIEQTVKKYIEIWRSLKKK